MLLSLLFVTAISPATGTAAILTSTKFSSSANAADLRLWYTKPAEKWDDALPVGNGRLGAMIFGNPSDERIQFNEDTLWTGKPHDYVRAGSDAALTEVRQLLAAGKTKEAEDLARAKMLSDPVRQKAYQPFGDLHLHFMGHENVTNYRRELDLDSAVARTTYEAGGVTYTEEVFASYPDNAIVVHLTASKPGAISFTLRMDSPHKDSRTVQAPEPEGPRYQTDVPLVQLPSLILRGRIQPDGLKFESRVRVFPTMGVTTPTEDAAITVEQADAVTLILVAATSFKNYADISADPAERTQRMLAHFDEIHEFDDKFYATLLARHEADYQNLFHRVSFVLQNKTHPSSETSAKEEESLPTDERLRRAKSPNGLAADPALAALEFQYGRYLLIASSRSGSQPATLQGIWNELLAPPWESKWTTNINLEMNYWPAEVANLPECTGPLFDLIDDLTVSGARTARELYRSRGWVVHHNTDLWRGTAPINNIDGIWPTGGAWLCWHLWEHWLFTGDRDFLERHAYPAMKSASLFFVDSLVRDSKNGWLVTSPSFSPEQGGMTMGPTMDNQLIRSLWQTTIAAAKILHTDADFATQLEKLLPQLPPNQIGKHGQLQEWLDDIDKPNNNHRHMSPLWALYPGADITPADPKIYDAAKLLLKWRGPGSTGWSYAWRIPLWARVSDGEYAYSQLADLIAKRTLPNLFDLCGPFQIDGNFGATAGIAEMLLQSQQRLPGETVKQIGAVIIDILPALPKEWPAGSVTGLRARGGFEVDLAWSDGKLNRVTLRSQLGQPCQLRLGDRALNLTTQPGGIYMFTGALSKIPQ
ncbi:MAG TPA: glycoside hydrolase family 95 protein [Lacunisphaera sp.]